MNQQNPHPQNPQQTPQEQPHGTFNANQFRRYYHSIEPVMNKPKNKVYTALILSFLAMALFAWYAIKPTIQTILYLRREISDKAVVNTQMEEKIASLIEAQAAYQSAESLLPLIDQAIPENPEAVNLGQELHMMAESVAASISGLHISTVPIIPDEASAGARPRDSARTTPEFTVNMTVDGTYDVLKSFIVGITTLRRIGTISTLSLNPAESNDQNASTSGNLQMTVSLKSYYKE